MARSKKRGRSDASDDVYNARRRYYRQAARYEKQATKAQSPQEAARLRNLATRSLEKSIATYENPLKAKMSKPIAELSSRLSPRKPLRQPSAEYQKKLIDESKEATAKGLSEDERREREASDILSSPIGSRIYAATVDIWKDQPEDRNELIKEYFGASDMMEVLERIEDIGIDLYSDPESEERYDEIRTAIELAFR